MMVSIPQASDGAEGQPRPQSSPSLHSQPYSFGVSEKDMFCVALQGGLLEFISFGIVECVLKGMIIAGSKFIKQFFSLNKNFKIIREDQMKARRPSVKSR